MLRRVFAGFPPEALTFYAGLEADNSKAYWQANRDVYEDAVREPLEELIEELAHEFGTAKVFRPYRDVRFSKDKSPYKTAAAAVMSEDGHVAGGRYVQIGANGLWCGGGLYEPDRAQLQRIRRAIDDQPGAALERIVTKVERAGLTYMAPDLKTAPRGYPKDHPRIDLLRRKRHAALARHEPGPWLHRREALDRIVADWRAITPLLEWLERHAGPPEERWR
jgi:uncharacterized protein (TIGR02453 family)